MRHVIGCASLVLAQLVISTANGQLPSPAASNANAAGGGPQLAPPAEADRQTIRAVIKLLTDRHLSGHPVDDEIAERAVGQFIAQLDSGKWYFLQRDVDAFQRRAPQLDDQLIAGDFTLTLEIFRVYFQRAIERMAWTEELLNAAHDFTLDERIGAAGSAFAKDEAEAREIWRKRVKNELLVHKSAGANDEEARRRASRVFSDFLRTIRQITTSDVVVYQADALARSFDPQTSFVAPKKSADFATTYSGQLVGVGLSLQVKSGYVTVTSVVPNGPAAKDGNLKDGHRLLAVGSGADGNWIDLVGIPLADAVKELRGERGSTVRIRYLPAGEFESSVCTLKRDTIEILKLGHHLFTADELPGGRKAKIGYINLPLFYRAEGQAVGSRAGSPGATREVEQRIKEFQSQGADVIVLDVRNNTGGSLTESTNMPGLFLGSAGTTVQVKGRDGAVQTYSPDKTQIAWNGPLVVLTSRESAGGTEILAGALQDAGRALIVGDAKTHGVGTVGSLVDVTAPAVDGKAGASLGQMKIITQKFYRPGGASIQIRGVSADVPLPSASDIWPEDESAKPYALRFDEVPAAKFSKVDFGITEKLIESLNSRSQARRSKSSEFIELAARIAAAQGTERSTSLNLDQFMAEERKKAEQKTLPTVPGTSDIKLDESLKEMLLVALDYTSQFALSQGEQRYAERKFKDALPSYRSAVAASPESPEACYKLGWALATCPEASLRNGNEAVKLAKQACELDGWQSWRFQLGLAVAEAEAGDFENAQKHLKTALEAAPAEQRTAFAYLEQRFERKQTFAAR